MPILSGGPLYKDRSKPIEDYTSSFGERAGAILEAGRDNSFLGFLSAGVNTVLGGNPLEAAQAGGRMVGLDVAAELDPANRVNAADARKAAEKRGVKLDIADDAYFSPGELQTVLYFKERERKQQAIRSRRPKTWGGFATEVGIGLAATFQDPVQVAANFIPVVPAARYAAWIERAGSAGGRAAVRAGVGAAEGLAGAAVLEPFFYGQAKSLNLDYTAQDSFLNLAFGTVLGGGLHALGGAVYDRATGAYREVPDAKSRAALHEAVTALDAGRPLDIQPVFENKSGVRPEGGTPASRANPDEPAPFSGERGQNAPSAPKVNAGDTASVVEATLRDLGIPYQVERSQFQSDKFGPSLSTYFRTDKGTFRLSDHLDVTGRDTFLIGDDPAKIRVEIFKAAGVEPTRYDTERLAALREIEAKQREWLRNEPSRKSAALSEWDAAALKDAGLSDLKGPEKTKALKKLRDAARASGEYPPKLPQMPDFGSLPPYRYPDPSAGVRASDAADEAFYNRELGRAPDVVEPDIAKALSDIEALAAGKTERAPDLVDAIKAMGGIKIVDNAGRITSEGGDVRDVFNRRYPIGLVNNRKGKPLDYVREALQEQGWLPKAGDGTNETTTADVLDLLSQWNGGKKPLPIGEVRGEDLRGLPGEMKAAGITKADAPDIAAFKLAKYRTEQAMRSAPELVREPSIAPEAYDPVTGYEPPEMERVRMEADAALTRADDDIDGEIEALNEMLAMAEKREPLNEFDRAALDLADAFETKSRISADSYRAAASCLSGLA